MAKYFWRKKRSLGDICLYVCEIEIAPIFLVF